MTAKTIGIYSEKPLERPYRHLNLSAFLIQELDHLYDRANTLDRYFNLRLVQKSDIDMEIGLVILTDQNFALFFALNQSRSVFFYDFNVSFLLHKPEPGELWSCFRGVWLKLDDEEKRNALWRTYSSRYLEQTKTPPLKKSKGNKSDESTTTRELAPSNHPAPVITPELLKQLGL
jgi:hypothetical protein